MSVVPGHEHSNRDRIRAAIGVALLHALLGYALILGLGVEVAIRRDEIGIRLTVCDQGKGLPEDWAERPSQGLGMKLIRAMLDQIGAQLEVENTRGACFSIRI